MFQPGRLSVRIQGTNGIFVRGKQDVVRRRHLGEGRQRQVEAHGGGCEIENNPRGHNLVSIISLRYVIFHIEVVPG
jgi:hypothetical protein